MNRIFIEHIPGLVNVYITNWKDPPFYSWVNPLFLWPFSIVFCKRLPEGSHGAMPGFPRFPKVQTMAPGSEPTLWNHWFCCSAAVSGDLAPHTGRWHHELGDICMTYDEISVMISEIHYSNYMYILLWCTSREWGGRTPLKNKNKSSKSENKRWIPSGKLT